MITGENLAFTRSVGGGIQETRRKFRWVTRGPNCPACNLLSGRVYPLIIWWDMAMPGMHPHCDCRLEAVDEEVPESSLDVVGIEPWIERLAVDAFTKRLFHILIPFDIRAGKHLSELYLETGDWSKAFELYDQRMSPNSFLMHPAVRIHNTAYPLPRFRDWLDDFFTPVFESPPTPSARFPHEEYR